MLMHKRVCLDDDLMTVTYGISANSTEDFEEI